MLAPTHVDHTRTLNVLLFIIVVPFMMRTVRRMRRETA